MSIRPAWSPVVEFTNAVPLPAFIGAPVGYALPVTPVPNTNPLSLRAIDVNDGQPLAAIVAE